MRCQNGVALSNAPMRCQNGVALSPGLGTQDRTCLQGIRMGLQDLTGSANKIAHAYEVLRPGCRISRVWNNRSNMTTRYQDEAVRSHGFERPDSTCLERIRTGLQDLRGKERQIVHAYEVSEWGCMISRVRNNSSNMHTRYQDGLQDLTGSANQIVHAYEVSGRGCRISRVLNTI